MLESKNATGQVYILGYIYYTYVQLFFDLCMFTPNNCILGKIWTQKRPFQGDTMLELKNAAGQVYILGGSQYTYVQLFFSFEPVYTPKLHFLGQCGPKNRHFRGLKCLNQKTLPARYTFWGIFSIHMCNRFFIQACLSPKLHFGASTDPKTAILGGQNA